MTDHPTPASSAQPNVYPLEIDVRDVAALQQSGANFLLVDVRQPEEFQTAAIAGAVLIPLGELAGRLNELEAYRDGRIVVLCHHGSRSMRAVLGLRQHGFAGVQNMAGGIDAWSRMVDPQIPLY